jgi:hypothetical protein
MKDMTRTNVRVVLYESTHKKPYGTDAVVFLGDIIVPKVVRKSIPNPWKMDKVTEFYQKHGFIDKPLLVSRVNNNGNGKDTYLLVDHYTRYKVLIEDLQAFAPVQYIDEI